MASIRINNSALEICVSYKLNIIFLFIIKKTMIKLYEFIYPEMWIDVSNALNITYIITIVEPLNVKVHFTIKIVYYNKNQ